VRGILALLVGASLSAIAQADTSRVVSGAGAITETICALGARDQLVAVDMSSVYPPEVSKLPQVGYLRQLAAEGILSVHPTLLLVTDDAGPPGVLAQIEKAGVRVVRLTNGHTPEAAEERIRAIGDELGKAPEAGLLIASMRKEVNAARVRAESSGPRPKVLFIYARGGGVMNVAGRATAADSIIALAGGTNAIQSYDGYKPLTAEAAAVAAPDFILVTSRGLESSGGVDALLTQPGLSLTPAGKDKQVIVMDDLLLLGFGPRLGQAVRELCDQLHPARKTTQR
jgi:iron complex transport system substrate-binding protein